MGRRRRRRRRTTRKTNRPSRRTSTAASKRRKVRSVAKAKRAANRSPSKSKTTKKSRKPMGRSRHTRGGQHAANKNQNKKAKRTVKSVKKAVSKGIKSVGKTIGKGIKGLKGAAAHASGSFKGKSVPKSKLQQQISNLKKDIAQKSTKEARFQRREDRLRNQFGLDYSRMNPSFKIDASIDQAAQKLGIRNHPLYQKYVPQDVKNWKFKYQMQAPTKLGASDGWRRPNRGGETVAAATRQQLADRVARSSHPEFVHSRREAAGLPSLRADPSQDISMMYQNILGREADQGGLDYWTNEFRSGRQSLDDIRKQFVRSDEFQGRSDADKSAALDGLKQRRNQSNRHLRGRLPMLGTIGSMIGRGVRPGRRAPHPGGKPAPGRRGRGGQIGSGTPGRRRPSPDRKGGGRGGWIGLLPRPGGGSYGDGRSVGGPERGRRRKVGKPYEGPRRGGPGRGRPKPPRQHGDPGPTRPPRTDHLRKKPKRKLSTSEAAIRRFEARRMTPVGKGRGVGKPTGRKNTGARRVRKSVGRRR